jgi:hypothetical protein
VAQDTGKILPEFLNLDSSYEALNPNESPFVKGVSVDINANPELGIATNNPVEEGQNVMVLTPTRSNSKVPDVILPEGYNLRVGAFDSIVTQELYWCNYNSNGNHGVYVLDGNTGIWSKVVEDSNLQFTDEPDHLFSRYRISLRLRLDADGKILEKHLVMTNGDSWQKWINVIAAVKTNGFDVSQFGYWQLQPPHFDRRELLEWATRPPMYAPIVTEIPNTDEDKGKINRLLDTGFQFCIQFVYTDGRETTVSPYSLPSIIRTTEFLSNPELISKALELELYAGSCMVEKVNIFYRQSVYRKSGVGTDLLTWSDWFLYETIEKFERSGNNSDLVIGTDYWLRTNPWANYQYNATLNTIKYRFDNSRLGQIVPQNLFTRIQNDIPQLSYALTELGDSLGLANNREGYDNLTSEVKSKLDAEVEYEDIDACSRPIRNVRMYVYVGRERGNRSSLGLPAARNVWTSQVGYFVGDDKQMRFGGLTLSIDRVDNPVLVAHFDVDESKLFELDFADKDAFRVYLKGTPYFADANWYVVNPDLNFELTEINGLIDAQNNTDANFVKDVLQGNKYFVGVFDLQVPAGRYIATLGRHNVGSDGDFRNTSTYLMGIANSRAIQSVQYDATISPLISTNNVSVTTLGLNSIVSRSKEIEIDCTSGDVDFWGNGQDVFYVAAPFVGDVQNRNRWSFIEGYISESETNQIPVELYPYELTETDPSATNGFFTDKNGFFFGWVWGSNNQNRADILFTAKANCNYPVSFLVPIDDNAGWKKNNQTYLDQLNGGQVGFANRILYRGRVTDPTGLIGYSNISVSVKDGQTVYTNSDGTFELVLHNGQNNIRVSNIYLNASGNFLITTNGCGYLPTYVFDESQVPCQIVGDRVYPTLIDQRIVIQTSDKLSLKTNASYALGLVGADLAGRVTFVNQFKVLSVDSFNKRNAISSSQIRWNLLGALNLDLDNRTKDLKWVNFYVTNANNYKKYVQWVGDKIEFIDASGNVTTDHNSASLVRISIDSLLNANVRNNFTLLSNYQFQNGDRLRIYDDGRGNLYDTDTFGDVIDVQIQGSNYNRAAVNANLIPPSENVVLSNTDTAGATEISVFVAYDSRFNKLKDRAGFWIELYTPSVTNEILPYFESGSFYPVVNGEIAEYVGGGQANPEYNYPQTGIVNYWDTYLIQRNISIPNVGSLFIGHPFESPNVTDKWGYRLTSGGRVNSENPFAMQMWYNDTIIRSDDFVAEGLLNGLGTFRQENKKSFKGFQRGGIVAIVSQFSTVLFICENDWFTTDFNYNYIYANQQGVQIANLDNNLGLPRQKIGGNFGMSYEDSDTLVVFDKEVYWFDRKNEAYVLCNYGQAADVADLMDEKGRRYGVKSYLVKKTQFINNWNLQNAKASRFDVRCGIDYVRKNIFITFRPRRKNTSKLTSYVNKRRNIDLKHQETLVFNLDKKRWTRFDNFTPEGYGEVRGVATGLSMVSFASGYPYMHNRRAVKSTLVPQPCCPEGYTQIGNACVKTIYRPAIFNPIADFVAVNRTNSQYSSLGASIYSSFNTDGTGVFTRIPLSNPFWVNNLTETEGALNRSGFWNSLSDAPFEPTWVEVTIPVEVPETKTYYVGLAADNRARITVDCVEVMTMDAEAMAVNHGTDNRVPFTMWHIYPIRLTEGLHFIRLGGQNFELVGENPASFGAEIYNNTPEEIAAATSYNDLNLVFSTSSLFNQNIGDFNYTCPDSNGCNNIVNVDGQYLCVSQEVIRKQCPPDKIVTEPVGEVSFLNFYEQQTEPVIMGVFNKSEELVKILQAINIDITNAELFIDLLYGTQDNSFTYMSINQFSERERLFYGALLRDMVSYLAPQQGQNYRSTLFEGKRMFSEYFVVRFVQDFLSLGKYFELVEMMYLFTNSPLKKP